MSKQNNLWSDESSRGSKNLLIIIVFLIVIAFVVGGIYFWQKSQPNKISTISSEEALGSKADPKEEGETVAKESNQSFTIPELPIEISFPKDYIIMKSGEKNRRGSFVSYEFEKTSEYDLPLLNEIQFFSEESIKEFTSDCDDTPCFFGDYPDLERYNSQKQAFQNQVDYQNYKLQIFNNHNYFSSTFDCTGDTCLIREYTTFVDDVKIDIWITIADADQVQKADELFSKLEIKKEEGKIYLDDSASLVEPIAEFAQRITKKPFGIFITPENSPVQPERFSGYHNAVDVEYEDSSSDVAVYAVADGTVIYSGTVNGYGGTILIRHTINNENYVAIYGHLDPASLMAKNTKVTMGQQIAILGEGGTTETDGERKHLHFSLRPGSDLNFAGYVQNQSELNQWVDPTTLIK